MIIPPGVKRMIHCRNEKYITYARKQGTTKCVMLNISDLDIPQVRVFDKHGSASSVNSSNKSYSPAASPRPGKKVLGRVDLAALCRSMYCLFRVHAKCEY